MNRECSALSAFVRTTGTAFLAAAVLLFSSCAYQNEIVRENSVEEIVILFTNDVHGNIRPVRGTWINRDDPPLVGGTASLASFYGDWTKRRGGPDDVLILDAGDFFQGTPEGNNSKGRLMFELMNKLGYDAATLGNHEFDFGFDNLKELIALADFPIMAENVRERTSGRKPAILADPVIFEQRGVKIGVAGILTDQLSRVAAVDENAEWRVEPEVPAAARAAWQLERMGADVVLLLSHCGEDRDSIIAANYRSELLPESGDVKINLIVGGHSHSRLRYARTVNGVKIVQTGGRGVEPGEVRIFWDKVDRTVRSFEYRLVELRHDTHPEDPSIKDYLAPHFEEIDRSMNRIVGKALESFDRRSRAGISSPLGNHQADLLRMKTGAAVGIMNKGGIRADIEKGDVTYRDLYTVSPFGNTIASMKLTGAQIKSLLEKALDGHHTTFEISGMTVTYDMSRPVGERVLKVLVGGEPLDYDKLYLTATISFLASGGDAYIEFAQGVDPYDSGINLLDAEVEFFESRPEGVMPIEDERWVRGGN